MEDDSQPPESPDQQPAPPRTTPEEVPDTPESSNDESETTQDTVEEAQPADAVSEPESITTDQPDDEQESEPEPPQATPPSKSDPFPVGMSASQLGLDTSGRHIDWRRYIRNSLYPIILILIVVGGLLFWKNYADGMATKTLSQGGYKYSFSFFRSAKFIQLSNGQGYTVNNEIAASVRANSSNLAQLCAEMGTGWTQAFTVTVYGVSRPVCTAQTAPTTQAYYLGFSALNQNQAFVVTYNKSQNSKVYPKLKSIFESVKVSK